MSDAAEQQQDIDTSVDNDNVNTDNSNDQSADTSSNSLLDAIGDDEGRAFDFTTGERPEGFPEDFWDAESNAVNPQALFDGFKKQEKIAKDLREKMGRGEHKAPEKAEDYTFEPSEAIAEFIKDDDPLVAAGKEIAHKYGMSQEQYAGFMSDMTEKMAELASDMSENGMSDEQKAEYIKGEIAKIGPNGPQVLRAVDSWAQELIAQGVFNEAMAKNVRENMLTSAENVQVFNALRSLMGGSEIPMGDFNDGLPPDNVIADKMNDLYEKAKSTGNTTEYDNYVNDISEKRRLAGRPTTLQF